MISACCWAPAACKPRSATTLRETGPGAAAWRGLCGTPTGGTPCSPSCTGIPPGNRTGATTARFCRPTLETRFCLTAQAHDFREYTPYPL